MKKLLLTGVAVLALTGAASAADLTYEPPAAPVVEAPAAFDWTGFYVGVHGGAGWNEVTGTFADDFDNNTSGLIGGQAGYNYQINQWVIGLETAFAYSWIENEGLAGETASLKWLGSTTGRVGYAMDRFLVYGKGGVAYGQNEYDNGAGASESNWDIGWTLGLGGEYAFTQNISAKLEYNYYDLGSSNNELLTGDLGSKTSTVTVGLNYKF